MIERLFTSRHLALPEEVHYWYVELGENSKSRIFTVPEIMGPYFLIDFHTMSFLQFSKKEDGQNVMSRLRNNLPTANRWALFTERNWQVILEAYKKVKEEKKNAREIVH